MQQINFIGRLETNEEATTFFIIQKTEETSFNFSQNAVSIMHYEMEVQKIIHLLNDSNNEEFKFATKNVMSQTVKQHKINTTKTILSNLRQKLLNQVLIICFSYMRYNSKCRK